MKMSVLSSRNSEAMFFDDLLSDQEINTLDPDRLPVDLSRFK